MFRRLLSLLLAIALFGAMGQGAAFAARTADPAMQMAHMTMGMADCMKMMDQSGPEKAKADKHKSCTPADCVNFMLACSGLAALPANDATPALAATFGKTAYLPGVASSMRGLSPPPTIQPPIA